MIFKELFLSVFLAGVLLGIFILTVADMFLPFFWVFMSMCFLCAVGMLASLYSAEEKEYKRYARQKKETKRGTQTEVEWITMQD